MVFRKFGVFFVVFVLLFSSFVFLVSAGVLKLSIKSADDGVPGFVDEKDLKKPKTEFVFNLGTPDKYILIV